MSSWREDFLSMSVDARLRYMEMYCRNISLRPGSLPPIPQWAKVRHTKVECVEFAKKHQIRCLRDMKDAIRRFSYESPPSIEGIIFLFGTWPVFLRQVRRGERKWRWGDPPRDRELVEICSKLNLETAQQYTDLRRQTKLGKMLPSLSFVIKRFGSWSLFRNLMLSYSIDSNLDRYFNASIGEGRPLSVAECDAMGIEIRMLKDTLGCDLFNRLLHERERQYRETHPGSFLSTGEDARKAIGAALSTRGRKKKKETTHEEQGGSEAGAGETVSEASAAEAGEKAEKVLQELFAQREEDGESRVLRGTEHV